MRSRKKSGMSVTSVTYASVEGRTRDFISMGAGTGGLDILRERETGIALLFLTKMQRKSN